MLQTMKNDQYPEGPPTPFVDTSDKSANEKGESSPFETRMSAYFSSSMNYPNIQVPIIKYKPSADCAYTQLISKIKGLPLPPDTDENGVASPGSASQSGTGDFDYSAYFGSNTNTSSGTNTPIPIIDIDTEKLAKNLKSIGSDGVEVKALSTGLMLAQYYNSDSETEQEDEEETIIVASKPVPISAEKSAPTPEPVDESKLGIPIPPEELKNIIEKTAAYVLKNGKEFEDILRAKNDDRFKFLHYANEHNKYYTYKVTGVVFPPAPSIISGPDLNGSQVHEDESKSQSPGPKSSTVTSPVRPVISTPKIIGEFY